MSSKIYFYTQFPKIDISNGSLSFCSCIRGKLGSNITGFSKIEDVEDLVRGCWHGEVYISWDKNKDFAFITTEYYRETVGVIQSLLVERQEE